MKKILSLLLVSILAFTVSACADNKQSSDEKVVNAVSDSETFASNENAQLFFDKVTENKKLLDPVFRSVCGAWKSEESKTGATVSDVNKAINEALKQHSQNITAINEADETISQLYELAIKCPASTNVEQVMSLYVAYKKTVINADASTNPGGYNDASSAKNSLDKALRNLRTVLSA